MATNRVFCQLLVKRSLLRLSGSLTRGSFTAAFYLSYAAILTPAFAVSSTITDASQLASGLGIYLMIWNMFVPQKLCSRVFFGPFSLILWPQHLHHHLDCFCECSC